MGPNGHIPKLLVVDDEHNMRVLTAGLLEEEGFNVTSVGSGEDALRAARASSFDLALIDVRLPDLSGLEVLRTLRKESPSTECVMITGSADLQFAVNSLKEGAKEFLTKPIRTDELVRRIKSILRTQAAENRINEMQAEFTSKLLHNLLSPLHTLQSTINFLNSEKAGPLSPQQKTMLHAIDETTSSMDAMLNDMIDLNLFESGRVDLEKIPANLDELLPTTIARFKARASAKAITLTIDVSNDVPTIELDTDRIEQVMVNLLENALAFTPDGGSINVRAQESTQERGERKSEWVEISVSDTGVGIAADELSSIFDKFKKLGADDTKERKTSGLGLTICKSIIEAHGGWITVESEVGKGSTFRLYLPVEAT